MKSLFERKNGIFFFGNLGISEAAQEFCDDSMLTYCSKSPLYTPPSVTKSGTVCPCFQNNDSERANRGGPETPNLEDLKQNNITGEMLLWLF